VPATRVRQEMAAAGLAALGRLRGGLPRPRHRLVCHEADMPVPMDDGVTLLTDMWYPQDATGGEPLVLVRSPYGRRGAISILFGHPLAQQGFRVVSQSCRGTGSPSETFAEPFVNEMADGQATVRWLREQSWFPGRFATAGASYLGFTQLALAVDPPPELAALVLQVTPTELRSVVYPRGVLALETALGWAQGVASHDPLLQGLLHRKERAARLVTAYGSAPLEEGYREATGDPVGFFEGWLDHPDADDPFWKSTDLRSALDRITVPTLIQGGWYDLFVEDSLAQYRRLSERGVEVGLTIGPWSHGSAILNWPMLLAEMVEWLDFALRDGPSRRDPVNVKINGGEWTRLPEWPPATQTTEWSLHAGGRLDPGPAVDGDPTVFDYDPLDPTPSVGGNYLGPGSGPRTSPTLDLRSDVATFTSEPLTTDMVVAGSPTAVMWVRADQPSVDLFVRLCSVGADGTSTNVCDQILRRESVNPTAIERLEIPLLPTANRFAAGQRLRLQVAGGAHPRFGRNPGTGESISTAEKFAVAHIEVFHDRERPSHIRLPLLP